MTSDAGTDRAWEDDIVHGLKSLTAAEVPSLEIILLDAVADWVLSPDNPGDGYGDEHAGHLISTLFGAVESARRFQPEREPTADARITHARTRLVAGAHELAEAGPTGVSLAVSRLMPALTAELQDNAGDRALQVRGVFVYLLYVIAVGTEAEQHPAVMDGLTATFAGWDGVLRAGFVMPWRRRPDPAPEAG